MAAHPAARGMSGGREDGPGETSAPPLQVEGTVRLDVWLWSARIFPTRSAATAACRGGHVRRGGEPAKAAQQISVGDELRVRFPGRERILVVAGILRRRVGAPMARRCYEDRSPEPPPQLMAAPPRRDRGTGRPTKKDRREMDRLLGRDGDAGTRRP
ncbi:RNA-binding S4 domain-containing protein [Brachybacterium hainanense]|uniref:RNA-binding S4 domain-containing protein n=1 Tax=Brachybacterium hainanense TaxID=1541174 RepID=A0ABV6RBF4_9MICO